MSDFTSPAKKRSTKRPNPSAVDVMVFQKILGRRKRGEKTYYKVQWKGQLLHTWEIAENLSPTKVAEFESETRRETLLNSSSTSFNWCLEPERILGLYEVNKELMFKMKWKDSTTRDFVPVTEAKLKCPQLVIAFYEQKIVWT